MLQSTHYCSKSVSVQHQSNTEVRAAGNTTRWTGSIEWDDVVTAHQKIWNFLAGDS